MILVEAYAPGIETEIIGICPVEELHEIMCPVDDLHLTLEFDDHYVICPIITFFDQNIVYGLNQ